MNRAVAVVLTAGLAVAACSADDDDGGDDASAPAATEAPDDDLVITGEGDAEIEFDRPEPESEPVSEADAEAEPSAEAPQARDQVTADAEDEMARAPAEATDGGGGLFDEDRPDGDRFEDNRFRDYGYRTFIPTDLDPLSTFALDVDTGSYSIARRWIDENALPPRESVRPEEYVNAFDYDYRVPRRGLEITVDGGPSPFDDRNHLVRIGVQAEVVDDRDRGAASLTFVIDTSGSMDRDDRLGLVKESLTRLVDELDIDDSVAIVTYSDSSGVVLPPTPLTERREILDAIDRLGPGGSTNLEAGLREGYELARRAFRDDGINRVILASDGVANAGQTDPDALARMIREDADQGIHLLTIGFGMGNFNDVTMEQLADQGDGFYAYVDTEDEAERLFEEELTSTLLTVAKDAKIQVEFDPEFVEEYRLIGFENRGVRDDDFRDDDVDAGELGAGHQVTAIYEIELARGVDPDDRGDLGTVSLRWEDPDTGDVEEIDEDIDLRDIEERWTDTALDFQLATVVATLAEVLRDNPFADDIDIDDLAEEADRLADDYRTRDVDDLADLILDAARLS